MIRRARPDDSDRLSALAWRSKAYWGYDDSFMQAHRQGLSVPPAYISKHPTYLLEQAEHLAGFYALDHLEPDLVELDFLFVEPRLIGRGVGRRLLSHARTIAHSGGYRFMRIVSDPNAAGFYQQMGAEPWGEWHSPVIPGRRLPVLQLSCHP